MKRPQPSEVYISIKTSRVCTTSTVRAMIETWPTRRDLNHGLGVRESRNASPVVPLETPWPGPWTRASSWSRTFPCSPGSGMAGTRAVVDPLSIHYTAAMYVAKRSTQNRCREPVTPRRKARAIWCSSRIEAFHHRAQHVPSPSTTTRPPLACHSPEPQAQQLTRTPHGIKK